MFTWICPKCGREVGPSYSECPFCAEAAAKPQAPVAPPVAVAPPQVQYVPPQPQYPPPPPVAPQVAPQVAPPAPPPPPPAQQVYYVGAEDHKRSIPSWLAAVLAFAAVALVAWGIISLTRTQRSSDPAAAKAAAAAKQKAAGNPYAKFLELTGFRINETAGKKLQVQFLAVNHGSADMSDVQGTITLKVKGSDTDDPACTFKFVISNLPGYGAKEVLVTEFIQKRKFFEMPDWLFLEPVVEITSE
jgi:hypothetical protein